MSSLTDEQVQKLKADWEKFRSATTNEEKMAYRLNAMKYEEYLRFQQFQRNR